METYRKPEARAGMSNRWHWEVAPDGETRIGVPPEQKLLAGPECSVTAMAIGRALVPAGPRRDPVFTVTSGGVIATVAEDLAILAGRAQEFAALAQAPATTRAYRLDWTHFTDWCARMNLAALPAAPGTVAAYLVAHADVLKISTLTRRLSSIAVAHRLAGYALDTGHPDLRATWQGIRRARGTAQRQVEALTVPRLKQVLDHIPGDRLIDVRDRALLLVGFSAALRRSELCDLDVADVAVSPEGLAVRVRRSKSDQEGEGATIAVGRTGRDTCPAQAFERWLAALAEAGITSGRAFRSVDRHKRVGTGLSTRAVAQIIQTRAAAAKLDAAAFSGHSMRAGFCTSAAAAGVTEREIMRVSRHRSVTVARRYIRQGELFQRNLAVEIGL